MAKKPEYLVVEGGMKPPVKKLPKSSFKTDKKSTSKKK